MLKLKEVPRWEVGEAGLNSVWPAAKVCSLSVNTPNSLSKQGLDIYFLCSRNSA